MMKNCLKTILSIIFSCACVISFVSCHEDESVIQKDVKPGQVFGEQLPSSAPHISSIVYNDKGMVKEMQTKDGKMTFSYYTGERDNFVSKVVASCDWDKSTFTMLIGKNGYINSCVKAKAAKGDEPATVEKWDLKYNYDGQLASVNYYDSQSILTIDYTYTDGDVTSVAVHYPDENIDEEPVIGVAYTSDKYPAPIQNKFNVMDFKDFFRVGIGDINYMYWAGLLGKATKHLPVECVHSSHSSFYTHTYSYEFDSVGKPVNMSEVCRLYSSEIFDLGQPNTYNYKIVSNVKCDISVGTNTSDMYRVSSSSSYEGSGTICEKLYVKLTPKEEGYVTDEVIKMITLDANSKILSFNFPKKISTEGYTEPKYSLTLADAKTKTAADGVVYVENTPANKKEPYPDVTTSVKMELKNETVNTALNNGANPSSAFRIVASEPVCNFVGAEISAIEEWVPVLDIDCQPEAAHFKSNPATVIVENEYLKELAPLRCLGAVNNHVASNNDGTQSMSFTHFSKNTLEAKFKVELIDTYYEKTDSATLVVKPGEHMYDLPIKTGCVYEYNSNKIINKYLEEKFGTYGVGYSQMKIKNNREEEYITPYAIEHKIYKYKVTVGSVCLMVNVYGQEYITIFTTNAYADVSIDFKW